MHLTDNQIKLLRNLPANHSGETAPDDYQPLIALGLVHFENVRGVLSRTAAGDALLAELATS